MDQMQKLENQTIYTLPLKLNAKGFCISIIW